MNNTDDVIRNMMRTAAAGIEPSPSCMTEISSRIDMLQKNGGKVNVKRINHKRRFSIKRIAAAAAVVTLLCTGTALAGGHITSIVMSSHSGYDYTTYESLENGMDENYIDAELPESFSNGYSFEGAVLTSEKAVTDEGNTMKQAKGVSADYSGKNGSVNLHVSMASLNGDQEKSGAASPTSQVTASDGTVISYNSDTYLFVPDGYELTAEQQARKAEDPHFFVSYDDGSDGVTTDVQDSVSWQKNGYDYILSMDHSGSSCDILVSMAEELAAK